MSKAYWVKVGDDWCVHADGARAGETVHVYRRDGTSSRVTLGAEIRPRIYSPGPRLNVWGKYLCEECGDYVYPGTSCWETGMTH